MSSTILDRADEAADHLRTLPAFSTLDPAAIIVDRQKDILNEVNKAVSKSCGLAVVFMPPNGRNAHPDLWPPRTTQTYSVFVFTQPVIRKAMGHISCLQAVETIIKGLHLSHFGNDSTRCYEWVYRSHRLVESKTFLIYQIDFETQIDLAADHIPLAHPIPTGGKD